MDATMSILETYLSAILTRNQPDKLKWGDLRTTCTNHINSNISCTQLHFWKYLSQTCHMLLFHLLWSPRSSFQSHSHAKYFIIMDFLHSPKGFQSFTLLWTFGQQNDISPELCLGTLFLRRLSDFELSECPWISLSSSHDSQYCKRMCQAQEPNPYWVDISKTITFNDAAAIAGGVFFPLWPVGPPMIPTDQTASEHTHMAFIEEAARTWTRE